MVQRLPAILPSRVRFGVLAFLCGALALIAQVETPIRRPTSIPTRSRSGQFLVLGDIRSQDIGSSGDIRVPTGPSQRSLTLNPLRPMDQQGMATLTPAVVSVACERVKAGVLRMLRLDDAHRGAIIVHIVKANNRSLPAGIVATQYADGWRYTLELQERMHWTLLVRTLVEALLLEIANRNNEGPLSPIPLWLSEGITTLLLGESGHELVPQLNREFKDPRRSMDPLSVVAAKTAGRIPMDFGALAMPPDTLPTDTNRFQWFQGSAALLVHQLRTVQGGQGALGRLVVSFNNSLNWQTGFLRTFSGEFASLLDVEKWWSVVALAFHAQDSTQRMTPQALATQVRSVLTETVEIAATTNSVPDRRSLRISEILEGWPYAAQVPVLERKLVQLRLLSRVGHALARRDGFEPADNIRLGQLDRCLEILARYREARSGRSGDGSHRGELDPRIRVLVSTTASRLRAVEGTLLELPSLPVASEPGR